jgi:hypothetical protein
MNIYNYSDLEDLILKAFDYYDNQNKKYNKYLDNKKIQIDDSKIYFFDKKTEIYDSDYEVLGIYDNSNKVWIWSWLMLELPSNKTLLTRKLLNYGLNMEPISNSLEHFYIRYQLVNSRFMIENEIELETHIGLISYLIKENHKFICDVYIKEHNLRYYYIVK